MCFVKLIATANPQDYYEGAECDDLRTIKILHWWQIISAVRFVFQAHRDGYTVIIPQGRMETNE